MPLVMAYVMVMQQQLEQAVQQDTLISGMRQVDLEQQQQQLVLYVQELLALLLQMRTDVLKQDL